MANVCVIGGGPAGSIFAIRMAELGHQVDVIEAAAFPRRHLGESLSPGVPALLRSVGAAGALDGARPVGEVEVAWDGPALTRKDERGGGLLVDRGPFDHALLDQARRLGVRVRQPARIIDRRQVEDGWRITIESEAESEDLKFDFLADARGRAAAAWRRDVTGPTTLALHAYWRGTALPAHPVIRADDAAWYWAVPLPDGACHLQVFVDAREFGALPKATLEARYVELLGRSVFKTGARQSPVQATDATPYVVPGAATHSSIALGEAALALDPLSSSGVQKAIQTALSGAIVANTLIKAKASAEAAMAFYKTSLAEASARHGSWARGYYAEAARTRPDVFWRRRAGPPSAATPHPPVAVAADAAHVTAFPVELSRDLVIEELPCIDGEFVTLKRALRHPGLTDPVAYLGNQPLAPLLSEIDSGATLFEIAQGWSDRMPFKSALSIAIWLRNRGILVEARP